MSKTHETGRNIAAVVAHFRGGAGAMKDKRAPRGGCRNDNRDFLADYEESLEIESELDDLERIAYGR